MIIKSVIELPQRSFFNHLFILSDNDVYKSKDSTSTKIHKINKLSWFLDIKNAAKTIAASKTAYVDLEHLPIEFQVPAAITIFKNMYKLQSYKTNKNSEVQLYFVKQYEVIKLLQSLIIGSNIATAPPNKMYPEKICQKVQKHFKNYHSVTVTCFDQNKTQKLGLNLVNAVGKGSKNGPRFLIIEIKNKNRENEDPIALVGKGVVFDSGGYNIKSGPGMFHMKGDKTGAGIVISIMDYFKNEVTSPNIVAIIPLVENLVSSNSYKVGDIYTAYNGKTIEILNTDAEGRLIMADALAYVSKNYKPRMILDFATLTGWAQIIHCDTSFIFFTTNDNLGKKIEACGKKMGERSIRLPNWPEYKTYTKSDIADYKNVNFECGRSDGFMASMFLMNFVDDPTKWAHFDVTHNINSFNMHVVNAAATAIKLISRL